MNSLDSVKINILTDEELTLDNDIKTVTDINTLYTIASEENKYNIFKYVLFNRHIRPIIYDKVRSVCNMFCKTCLKLLNLQENCTMDNEINYYKFIRYISSKFITLEGSYLCRCGGRKKSDYHDILMLYKYLSDNNYNTIFNICSYENGTTKFCVMIPYHIIYEFPSGIEAFSSYRKLIEDDGKDILKEYSKLCQVYNCMKDVIKGKEGMLRSDMIPVHLPNSGRAVIISDFHMDVDQMRVPGPLTRVLASNTIVNQENFYDVLSNILQGKINIILAKNVKHNIIKNSHFLRVYIKCQERIFSYKLSNLDGIAFNSERITRFYDNKNIVNIHKNIKDGEISKVFISGTYYDIVPKTSNVILACNIKEGDMNTERKVIYDMGMTVLYLRENSNLLVHRNPVMFGRSMQVHKALPTHDSDEYSLNHQERLDKETKVNNMYDATKGVLEYKKDIPSIKIKEDKLKESFMSSVSVKIEYPRKVETRSISKNECLSMHPFTCETYNADFDGDMANVKSLEDEIGNKLHVTNNILHKKIGISYESVHGLYIITEKNYLNNDEDIQSISNNIEVKKFILYIINNAGKFRQVYKNKKVFNKLIIEYHLINGLDTRIEKFISEVILFLLKVCDRYGLTFDRFDKDKSNEMVLSGCKPSKSSYNSIYNSIGIVKCILPKSVTYININDNYLTGLNFQEYFYMCISSRKSAAEKAINTSIEGDIMRLISNYLSQIKIKDSTYIENSKDILTMITKDYLSHIQEKTVLEDECIFSPFLDSGAKILKYSENRSTYKTDSKIINNCYSNGQRKLLISELYFLSKYSTNSDVIVYPGAASGSHISILHKLFPNNKFILYDKVKFSNALYEKGVPKHNIYIREKYLNMNTIQEELLFIRNIAKNDNIILISDIRTDTEGLVTDINIEEDNLLNIKLIECLNPKYSMIPLRFPYNDKTTTMPEGLILKQCWAPRFSTETRLIVSEKFNMINYDNRSYENMMYYHNIKRSQKYKCYIIQELERYMKSKGISPYYDMYLETYVIHEYVSRRLNEKKISLENIENEMSYVYNVITKNLYTN